MASCSVYLINKNYCSNKTQFRNSQNVGQTGKQNVQTSFQQRTVSAMPNPSNKTSPCETTCKLSDNKLTALLTTPILVFFSKFSGTISSVNFLVYITSTTVDNSILYSPSLLLSYGGISSIFQQVPWFLVKCRRDAFFT